MDKTTLAVIRAILASRLMAAFLLLFASAAMADCNCVAYSIEALSRMHIRLKTIPAVAENDWFKHPGAYSRGVVNVRDIDNCRVMLHEFSHHWQYERWGEAKTLFEWQRREMQAAQITMLAESEYGDHKCE